MTSARRLLAIPLAVAIVCAACSDERAADRQERVLATLADEVIVPSYEALVANLDALAREIDALCAGPSREALDRARAQWRDADLAWATTRAGGVGPAITRRLMGAVGFRARPDAIEAVVAGDGEVSAEAVAALGADTRGLSAIEVALFGPPSESLLDATGARRCRYARSVAEVAGIAGEQVLDDWAGAPEPYRDTLVDGMDGSRQDSVEALVNEVTFRLQELDDAGLRAMAAAESFAELPAQRREGPAAFGIAYLRGLFEGVVVVLRGPDDDGLVDLVRSRSADTADRLERLIDDARRGLAALPPSMAASFADRPALEAAADAMAALKVLVGTEVASVLGATIGFSDADGDA